MICWALLAFMISFNLFIPELNDFITNMGGADQKGFIFLLFSISAAVSRPFAGKLSDTIGRKKVMYIGIIVGFAVTLVYPLSEFVLVFLFLRFMHGFSAGFLPTGATALVTDILPAEGRGVAMGIWGTFIALGFGVGNVFSEPIRGAFGLTGLFMIAACFSVIAALLTSFLRETLPEPKKFRWQFLKVKWVDVFEPTVRPAAFVMFCSAISTGIVFVTFSDIAGYVGLSNKGTFFAFYATSTIVIRLFASSLSDRIGRRKTTIIGLSFMVAAMTVIATSQEYIQYCIGATVYGISVGISSPTIMAWIADLSPAHRRGVGAGTLFIALEIAIMAGSFAAYLFYDSTFLTIPQTYAVGVLFSMVGIGYLVWHLLNRESKT